MLSFGEFSMESMKDSGQRQTFATGAVRDSADNKCRPDLISPFALERLGEWLRLGSLKYEERNWEKGIPLSRSTASLCRHLLKFQQGEHDEDHLAAIMCNAMFIIHTMEMVRRGVLPPSLLDLPKYRRHDPYHTSKVVVTPKGPRIRFAKQAHDEALAQWDNQEGK